MERAVRGRQRGAPALPADAATLWDAHAHVIGDPDRYPLWPGRRYDPPTAPLPEYLDLLDRLGVHRGVLVQPSVYGFDNRCMLDALDEAGGRLVGVAVPAPDSRPRDLEALHRAKVRAVRCNPLSGPGGLDVDTVLGWRPVLRELGWHVEVHLAMAEVHDLRTWLARFEVPVVIDHMGRPAPGRTDPDRPENQRLVQAVRDGACRVKLSAPYRYSSDPPPWLDVAPLARAFLESNAAACLWATDWPHTDTPTPVGPRDLMAALDEWCPDAAARRSLMARAGELFPGPQPGERAAR